MLPLLFSFLSIVRGVVFDPSGRPVEGAKIACAAQSTTTNAEGRFEIPSPCLATIEKDGFAKQTVALTDAHDQTVRLKLAPASDRVLVTASAAPVALEEAGVAATVFTARDLEIRQQPFLSDLLRDTPGLSVVQTGRNGGLTSVFARGGDSDAAMVLLDGIPITEPGGDFDFVHLTASGIDRVELVRGPESALYGAEASSAVIQIFTRRGDPESSRPHGSFVYERGSFSTDHWAASLTGGLRDRIDYALSADQYRSTGEFANNVYRVTSGTANLAYHLSNTTVLRAIFREFDSFTGIPGQVDYGVADTSASEAARDSSVSLHFDDARGSRFTQKVIFGYHRNSTFDQDNSSGDPYTVQAYLKPSGPYVYFAGLAPATATIAPAGEILSSYTYYPYTYQNPNEADRTNAQYTGTWTHPGGALSFGYEYERQAGDLSGANVARSDNGLFLSDNYAVTRRVFLTASARYQQSSTFGSEFAPRAAVTFRLPTETFLRFSASRGVKEPSLLENFANAGYYVGNPNLKPETTQSYEAGLAREWLARRLRTELSVFRNSFHNLIEYNSAVYPGTWINVDQSWARGAEASASYRVTSFAAVRGAYTRLDTRITDSITASDVGQPLLRRPRNSGNTSLEITPKRWMILAGARFVGQRRDNDYAFGANRLYAYQYVFFDASYQATRLVTPFFRVQNALDRNYEEVLGYPAFTRNITGGLKIAW